MTISTPMRKTKMRANEKFLQSLCYMNSEMIKDKKADKPWRYTNVKKRYATFEEARKHNRLTNCVTGVQMGLLMAGLPSGINHWYGSQGKIVYTSDKGKKVVPQYFEIKHPNKTTQTLYKNGELCDGDFLIYKGMNHTNCYFGGDLSFDSGHAFTTPKSGELAVFNKWIGKLTYKTAKVGTILRLKDRAHYRVQCGAYSDIGKYEEQVQKVEEAGFKTTKIVEDGMMKVQVGYFSGKTNAERMAAHVREKGIDVFVKEI